MNNHDNLYPHHRSPFYLRERVSYSVPNPPYRLQGRGRATKWEEGKTATASSSVSK
ncbi:MAG: hypothetical protein SO442_08500 [Prevotella sp.]|nr:hypothetical protein [Prevotella sp.]